MVEVVIIISVLKKKEHHENKKDDTSIDALGSYLMIIKGMGYVNFSNGASQN